MLRVIEYFAKVLNISLKVIRNDTLEYMQGMCIFKVPVVLYHF